jgi:hypothetical protein
MWSCSIEIRDVGVQDTVQLLITAYPTKPSGVFFVLPARRKQDRGLLIALACLRERLSEMDYVAV